MFSLGEGGVEVVNAISGKVNTGTASRLCKQRMFGKFVGLLDRGIKSRNDITIKNAPQFYADVKAAAVNYQVISFFFMNIFSNVEVNLLKLLKLDHTSCIHLMFK